MKIHLMTFNKEEHLGLMAHWWLKRRRPVPAEYLIPELGYVAYNEDGIPVCAATLLTTSVPYSVINNLVTNPDAHAQLREAGIIMVMEGLVNKALELGCKIIGYGTNVEKMIPRCEKMGFTVYDKNITVLGKEL